VLRDLKYRHKSHSRIPIYILAFAGLRLNQNGELNFAGSFKTTLDAGNLMKFPHTVISIQLWRVVEALRDTHGKVHWRLQTDIKEFSGSLASADNIICCYFGILGVSVSAIAGP
jgi:hypothetical protein